MSNPLQKRCERCEGLFKLPKIRKDSRAFMLMIRFHPCPLCCYVEKPKNPKFNKSGRCRDCSIPFSMIEHKAKGRCHRCLMAHYRKEGSTNSSK